MSAGEALPAKELGLRPLHLDSMLGCVALTTGANSGVNVLLEETALHTMANRRRRYRSIVFACRCLEPTGECPSCTFEGLIRPGNNVALILVSARHFGTRRLVYPHLFSMCSITTCSYK